MGSGEAGGGRGAAGPETSAARVALWPGATLLGWRSSLPRRRAGRGSDEKLNVWKQLYIAKVKGTVGDILVRTGENDLIIVNKNDSFEHLMTLC